MKTQKGSSGCQILPRKARRWCLRTQRISTPMTSWNAMSAKLLQVCPRRIGNPNVDPMRHMHPSMLSNKASCSVSAGFIAGSNISVTSTFIPRDATFTKVDDVDSMFPKDTECLTFYEAVRTSVPTERWRQSIANSEHRPIICREIPNKFSASDAAVIFVIFDGHTMLAVVVVVAAVVVRQHVVDRCVLEYPPHFREWYLPLEQHIETCPRPCWSVERRP